MRFGTSIIQSRCSGQIVPITGHQPFALGLRNGMRNTLSPVHESSERCYRDPEARIGEHLILNHISQLL
jgi:hypothetical protein